MNPILGIAYILLTFFGCNVQVGQEDGHANFKSERFELALGDTLQYNLGHLGDEDRALIEKHPKHNAFHGFCSPSRQPLVYCYIPREQFEGADTVIIKLSFGSDGSSPPTDHRITVLILELTQN